MYKRARNALNGLDGSQQVPLEQAVSDPIYRLIMQAQIDNDLHNKGIETSFRNVDGNTMLVRDAKPHTKPSEQQTTRYEKIMIGLPYFKAAHTFAMMEGKTELAKKISLMAEGYYSIMSDPEKVPKNELQIEMYSNFYLLQLAATMKVEEKPDPDLASPTTEITTAHGKLKDYKQKYNSECERFKVEIGILNKIHFWIGLEEPTFGVATISRIPTKENMQTIVQMDLPIIDQEMYERYGFRHLNDPDKKNQPPWIQALSDLDQRLVRHYADKIKEGRVIPSQLRSVLPGLKNSYQSIIGGRVGNNQNFNLLSVSNHNATIVNVNKTMVTEGKYNNDMLTRFTLEAQQKLTGADKLLMVTLNSEHGDKILSLKDKIKRKRKKLRGKKPGKPFFGFDGPIVSGTRDAAQYAENLSSSNVCLNHFSRYFPNDYQGIFELIELCNSNLKAATPNAYREGEDVFKLVIKGNNPIFRVNKKALDALQRNLYVTPINSTESDPKLTAIRLADIKSQIGTIVDLSKKITKEMRRKKLALPDQKVRGRRIVALSSQLSFTNNLIAEAINYNAEHGGTGIAHPLQTHAQTFGCASGDNRTQAVAIELANTTINEFSHKHSRLGRKVDSKKLQKVVDTIIAENGHNALMPGFQGSTLGLTGIRGKSRGAFAKNISGKLLRQYLSKSADQKDWSAMERRQTEVIKASAKAAVEIGGGSAKSATKYAPETAVDRFKKSYRRVSSQLRRSRSNTPATPPPSPESSMIETQSAASSSSEDPTQPEEATPPATPSLIGERHQFKVVDDIPRPTKPLPHPPKPLPVPPNQQWIKQKMTTVRNPNFDSEKVRGRTLPTLPGTEGANRQSKVIEPTRRKTGRF